MSALSWCGLAMGLLVVALCVAGFALLMTSAAVAMRLLVVALWLVGFALLMTRVALAQAQLENEQLDYDWRSAMQKMQRRGRHDL